MPGPGRKFQKGNKFGGAGRGQGRPQGAINKRSEADARKAARSGVLPKEVMLEATRFHYALYLEERAKGDAADPKRLVAELHLAHEHAKDAAPYYDPKLQAVAHFGEGDKPESLSNARERLARLVDLEDAAGEEEEHPPTAH